MLAPGVWLRLVRTGDVITTYYRQPFGTNDFWVALDSQTFDSLPSTMLVGFAVTSHQRGTLAQAVFEEIELIPGSSEWVGTDIGDVGAPGSSSVDVQSGPEFTVHGSGADVWGTADEFHFLSREAVGDFDFAARVVHFDDIDKWTKAGLMMRDGLSAHAQHAFIIQTPRTDRGHRVPAASRDRRQHRPHRGPAHGAAGIPATRAGGRHRQRVPQNRTGGFVDAGRNQTFTSLPETVRIGFAVSSHVDGTLATAFFDNLRLMP